MARRVSRSLGLLLGMLLLVLVGLAGPASAAIEVHRFDNPVVIGLIVRARRRAASQALSTAERERLNALINRERTE